MSYDATLDDIRSATPEWVPQSTLIFLAYKQFSQSMRQIARELDIQPSTVSRSIKKTSQNLTDPLFALAMKNVSQHLASHNSNSPHQTFWQQTEPHCNSHSKKKESLLNKDRFRQDSKRLLELLAGPGQHIVVSVSLEKIIVANVNQSKNHEQKEVFDRAIAEAFALKGWITPKHLGKVLSYEITSAARSYLEHCAIITGKKKDYLRSSVQQKITNDRQQKISRTDHNTSRFADRGSELPMLALARLRDKSGEAFLTPELVSAGHMLREDFELSELIRSLEHTNSVTSKRVASGKNHSNLLTTDPRVRLEQALNFLGPVLSDVALRCCCYLQGMEQIEKSLGWSARSGKIVLRIALIQLLDFYSLKAPTKTQALERSGA